MYRINDKAAAIAELQKYLEEINVTDSFIAPSGVYDDATREAVISFQKSKQIEPSGIVDIETYKSIYAEYVGSKERGKLEGVLGSFMDFPTSEGDFFPEMAHIKRTIGVCLDYYGHTHSLRMDGYFSAESTRCVKLLRKIYKLPDKDSIDHEFYLRLIKDYDSIVKPRKY